MKYILFISLLLFNYTCLAQKYVILKNKDTIRRGDIFTIPVGVPIQNIYPSREAPTSMRTIFTNYISNEMRGKQLEFSGFTTFKSGKSKRFIGKFYVYDKHLYLDRVEYYVNLEVALANKEIVIVTN